MSAQIISVDNGSFAERAGIKAGDILLSVNSHRIEDVFDYQFYTYDNTLDIEIEREGKKLHFNIKKSDGEYIGLNFETYLMDEQKSCYNKCIFCFIDQNPKGMRETIYFKDDDARLSFLVGNYISLTNLSDKDAERIVKMHFSPLNISVHTTDPELRKLMLGNRFAGDALRHLKTFADAGLEIKTQIVVCPGVNDGENLKKTLSDLSDLYPSVVSIACVPVGLSKHREGLYPLTPMDEKCARECIEIIDYFRKENEEKHGEALVHASDEFYIKAKMPFPDMEYYADFEQLDNGVGLMPLFEDQVRDELNYEENIPQTPFTVVTGMDAAPFIEKMLDYCRNKWHNLECNTVGIVNDFYGENVTVAGLVTGRDIIAQLKNAPHHKNVLIPVVMLRHGETVFLDDVTIEEIENELDIKITVCEIDGMQFVNTLANL